MRDDYEEKKFSPMKVGLIGAVLIAVVVGFLVLQTRASDEKAALSQQIVGLQHDLKEAQDKNAVLKKQLAEAQASGPALQKRLTALKSESVSAIRDTESKFNEVKKMAVDADSRAEKLKADQAQMQAQMTTMKKTSDTQAKQLQDQLSRAQSDLQSA